MLAYINHHYSQKQQHLPQILKKEVGQEILDDNNQEPKKSSNGSKSILALMGIAAAGGTLYLLSKGKKGKSR